MSMLIKNLIRIPNTTHYDQTTIHIVSVIVAIVSFFDLLVLGSAPTISYFLTRGSFIAFPYLYAHLFKNHSIGNYVCDFFIFNYFTYAIFYSHFYSYVYVFAFIQFGIGMAGIVRVSARFYIPIAIYAVLGSALSIFWLGKYPTSFTIEQVKVDLASSVFTVFIFSFFIYYRSARERDRARQADEVFADIGKRLSIVLHELQGTLWRIGGQSREFFEIQELVTLMRVLSNKDSKAIKDFEQLDFSSLFNDVYLLYSDTILSSQIKLKTDFSDLTLRTERTSLHLILKNLFKNAIEEQLHLPVEKREISFSFKQVNGHQILTCHNSARERKVDVSEIMRPFVSDKDNVTNQGLGLYIITQLGQRLGALVDVQAPAGSFRVRLNLG